jgi:hypothetical protein
LASLTNLQTFVIYSNHISGVSPLTSLTKLQLLGLNDNQISNISPLTNLTDLQVLYLGANQISDISALTSLTKLQQLGINYNQISNISLLTSLTKLQVLYLGANQISDISPLTNLPNLQILELHNNQITSISPLINNTGLGSGDIIDVSNNYLDIRVGMPERIRIQTLVDRGAQVTFEPQRTYLLTLNVVGSGNTNPSAGVNVYPQGASLQITAIPGEGWVFSHWSGNAEGNLKTITVVMNANKSITANFAESGYTLIGAIKQNPTAYNGKIVTVSGTYLGWQAGHGFAPVNRSDWLLEDNTGTIYITGSSMNLNYPADVGKPVKVVGTVRLKNGIPYIEVPGSRR